MQIDMDESAVNELYVYEDTRKKKYTKKNNCYLLTAEQKKNTSNTLLSMEQCLHRAYLKIYLILIQLFNNNNNKTAKQK